MLFSNLNREIYINEVSSNEADIIIIGGGITGAGIALDAASRGLKVFLIEKEDFASGTSSRSTKLIHGGLRYLEQFEFALVREVGRERDIIFKNAPHLVEPEKMLLPIIESGTLNRVTAYLGLTAYDYLADVKTSERKLMLSKDEIQDKEPLINMEVLIGGVLYYEYRTSDSRLTIEVLKKASEYGAIAINYCKATSLVHNNGKVAGVEVTDSISNKKITIKGKTVVNATGPWVDDICKLENQTINDKLKLTKGIHITIKKSRLPINHSVYFDISDGRMVFAIPRKNTVYIGTTDTFYSGDLEEPQILREDVDYLIKAVNQMFPSVSLTRNDVISSWAGLRPLIKIEGKPPSELSRKDEIFVSDSQLITIAGGKLTGYRLMAKKIVDMITNISDINPSKNDCQTENLLVSGANLSTKQEDKASLNDFNNFMHNEYKSLNIPTITLDELVSKYGENIKTILSEYTNLKPNGFDSEKLLIAEVTYSIKHEMSISLTDFFIRRTSYLHFEIQEIEKILPTVLKVFTTLFNWDEEKIQKEKDLLSIRMDAATAFKKES